MESDGRLLSKWQSAFRFHKVESSMTVLCTRKSLYEIILFVNLQSNLFVIIADFPVSYSLLAHDLRVKIFLRLFYFIIRKHSITIWDPAYSENLPGFPHAHSKCQNSSLYLAMATSHLLFFSSYYLLSSYISVPHNPMISSSFN